LGDISRILVERKHMLDQGATTNARDEDGWTAPDFAAKNNDIVQQRNPLDRKTVQSAL
jgi:ankyrin repeat protein